MYNVIKLSFQKIGTFFWLSSKSFLPVSDSQLLTAYIKKNCEI